MRRKDREISEKERLLEILGQSDVCRLAISSNSAPYIVPLNFGYVWNDVLELYFHSARDGRKIDLLLNNNLVGFEIDAAHKLVSGEKPCDWSMNYQSIIGEGLIEFLESENDQINALNRIMDKYGASENYEYQKELLPKMRFYKLVVKKITGKASC